MPQFNRKTGGLNRIHPAIPADYSVMIFPCLPMVAEHSNLVREPKAVCDHGASFSKCAEIFPGIKTEATDFANRPSASILVFCAVRLGGVFNYGETMLLTELENRVHISHLAKEMNRNK